MRIVSLLPSATEIVYALGLGEQLLAVTHECDFPDDARSKPVITSSVLDHRGQSSESIHKGITGLVHEGHSIYHLNEALLAELRPDLILTQELCEVCAVSYKIVEKAARILEADSRVVSLEPNTIWDILDNIRLVGRETGVETRAAELTAKLNDRILNVKARTTGVSYRPKVYCMEWLDPPFAAGHWIAEMVTLAGGHEGLALDARPSEQITWQAVLNYAPEVLVLMPCGFDLQQTLDALSEVCGYPGWLRLPAVQSGKVFAVDGSGYFNRPGPRIVDGLEILAEILHPELCSFPEHRQAFRKVV